MNFQIRKFSTSVKKFQNSLNKQELVSVVVPNFNHSKYLKQRIDSILSQTFQDFELIILDDCSTDESVSIIETYRQHPKVSQIAINERNSGSPFKQWGKGLELSKGDYIWIAESDDWADKDFLTETITKIKEDKEIGLVYCNSNMFVNESCVDTLSNIKSKILKNSKWDNDYITDGYSELNDTLILCCSINNASAVLFRKDILLKADPFEIDFKFIGDWYCYLKVASLSKIAYINKTLNNYRDHPENISKLSSKENIHLKEYFLIYDWIFRNVKIENKELVLSYFLGYTRHSVKIFNYGLVKIYKEIYKINKLLFLRMLEFQLTNRFSEILKRLKNILILVH